MMQVAVSHGDLASSPARDKRSGSKRETIRRLHDSALKLFSDHGFEGTSLRDIAVHANVPLSTINRYFGSKLDLFNELEWHIWKEVNVDREALMRPPIEVDSAGRPTLYAILYAFIRPVVLRAVGDASSATALRLLREYAAMRLHAGLRSSFTTVAERWVNALMAACPELSRRRAVWSLAFVVSVTFSDQLQHGWYDELMPEGSQMSADEVTDMIIRFCSSGIGAVAKSS